MCVTSLNLQEALNVIEKIDFENYRKTQPISKKSYRQIATERQNVKNKMQRALNQIKTTYEVFDDTITFQQIESFVNHLDTHCYEPIDYITANTGCLNGFNYITDDSDFKSDNNFLTKQNNLYVY